MKHTTIMDRGKAYATLSDLIFKGFLSTEMDLGGKRFIFKTVNEKEYDLIKLYAGNPGSTRNPKFNVYFLIFSLFVLGNEMVIPNRDKEISGLYNFFLGFPKPLFEKIINELNNLREDAYNSMDFLEGFSYTYKSRRRWGMMDGEIPCKESFTGISGTYNMGLNYHQESWMIINQMLDKEEKYNTNYSLALLVASASNPKGTNKLRTQHDTQVEGVEEKRSDLAENGKHSEAKKWDSDGWATSVDTAEDLVKELDRQMKGKQDRHDLFIEKYIRDLEEQAKRKTEEVKARIEAAREEEGGKLPYITGSQRVLTAEEAENLMKKPSKSLIEVASEDVASTSDKEHFIKKVGKKVLTSRN